MSSQSGSDQLQQETIIAIVSVVAAAVQNDQPKNTRTLNIPGGPTVGKQITIDATGDDKLPNTCRLSLLQPLVAPEGEVARIEYEHDKQGKFGLEHVYSIQSVRQTSGELVLLENFLAEAADKVREEDFRPIRSEPYARATVLKTLEDWTKFRAWQLKNGS